MAPDALILLANLGRLRRPGGAAAALAEPVLPDPTAGRRQLDALVADPLTGADLPALRQLHEAASAAAEALLAGRTPAYAGINALAGDSTARLELVAADGGVRPRLVWTDATVASGLARRLVEELGALAPDRLRRCSRTECDLLFYDTTRSRTRRWHAEDPCGWRERQHQRRHPTGRSTAGLP